MIHGPGYAFGVYFPLTPPALAQSRAEARLRITTPTFPLELLDFMTEPFYMAYAPLHTGRLLYRSRERRIETYRSSRDALATELRTQLDRLAGLPDAERRTAFRELATRQSPRLEALEAEAEAIRVDLTSPSLLHTTNDGVALRVWRDAVRDQSEPLSEYLAALVNAQFHPGLSPAQRRLLHELALEFRLQPQPDVSALNAESQTEPYLFFLPETARIRLPAALPLQLAAHVQRFREVKDELKSELRNAVKDYERFFFVWERTRRFEQLAERQAARFAELERLAEQIRTGLAELPYPDEPPRSELPAELTRRVGALIADTAELRRDISAALREYQAVLPSHRVELVRKSDRIALAATPDPERSRLDPQRVEPILAEMATFSQRVGERSRALTQETEALRREIQRYADTQPRNARSVEQWAAAFNASYAAQENWNRYRDYRRAVLEPGLSPAQRRLLYQAALLDLVKAENKPAP